ncbi:uncharacterized protein B0I36DRAFT_166159 [Microdochium trichocladiopsis]|uniref:Uncharacterized protein n=1 Tax=Microdochium trichocladiopsis TaxID=1682393 RepID=A0A9P8XYI5_9PEZI|nr:uncharacterized protein B0I36DRAFT_166159 [Microdochium trichocladiopsis]KAH7025127.1 hypothetical protein B0I36DRAFT_166159 [Microdochium trichocladiopsis]
MLHYIFRSGTSPYHVINPENFPNLQATEIWSLLLYRLVHNPFEWWGQDCITYAHRIVNACLRYGLEDDVMMRLDACCRITYSNEPILAVRISLTRANGHALVQGYKQHEWLPLQSRIVQDLRRLNGEASMRQVLSPGFWRNLDEAGGMTGRSQPDHSNTPGTSTTPSRTDDELAGIPLDYGLGSLSQRSEWNWREFPNRFVDLRLIPQRGVPCMDHTNACYDSFEQNAYVAQRRLS